MYFTKGKQRAFELLMQQKPGFDRYQSGCAGDDEDCGTCRFYRPGWKYEFCVFNKHFPQTGTRLLCLLSTPYPHRKAVFVARSFDFGRKKRLQPPCAAISCFPYCEVSPLLVRLPLSPLLLRLQSVCLYRSYRPAARQAAAARWISPHCCSGRKIDLPKYDTGLQGHRIPVNSAVVPCSRYSQGSAGKYITRRLPFCGSRRIHFSRLL